MYPASSSSQGLSTRTSIRESRNTASAHENCYTAERPHVLTFRPQNARESLYQKQITTSSLTSDISCGISRYSLSPQREGKTVEWKDGVQFGVFQPDKRTEQVNTQRMREQTATAVLNIEGDFVLIATPWGYRTVLKGYRADDAWKQMLAEFEQAQGVAKAMSFKADSAPDPRQEIDALRKELAAVKAERDSIRGAFENLQLANQMKADQLRKIRLALNDV